jgi:hypothetical protein
VTPRAQRKYVVAAAGALALTVTLGPTAFAAGPDAPNKDGRDGVSLNVEGHRNGQAGRAGNTRRGRGRGLGLGRWFDQIPEG